MDLEGIIEILRDPNLERNGFIWPPLIPISTGLVLIWPLLIQPWVDQTFSDFIDPYLEWIDFYLASVGTALSVPNFFRLNWSQSWVNWILSDLYWYSLEWTRLFQTLLIPISIGFIFILPFLIQPWVDQTLSDSIDPNLKLIYIIKVLLYPVSKRL